MQRESLKVLNLRYQKLAELMDNSMFRARNIDTSTKVNEIPQLTFKVPAENPKVAFLLNEYLVEYKDEYYVIKTPEVERSDDGSTYYQYSCSHLSNTLQSNTLTLNEVTPRTAPELMALALGYENDKPTLGWSVGTIEVDTAVKRGLEISEQSSFAILCQIADKYSGMLKFHSKTRKVDLLKLDDSIKPKAYLTLRKNLKGIKVTYDSSEMVTRMYCFGAEDKNGNEIDIMSVNPTGKPYIENYSYYYGLGYTDADITNNPELFVKTNIWRDSNYVDPADLLSDGIKELERVSKPKIEVNVSALDTSQVEEYQSALNLNLGDVVVVVDYELGIKFRCHVIERQYNSEEPYMLNITLTNDLDYKNVLSELFSTVGTVGQVVTQGGTVQGSHINSISTNQVRNLSVEYCSIEHLTAEYIDAKSIAAKYALIADLNALNIETGNLKATQAEILSLLAGNVGAENIQTIHLTADNVVIDDAVVKELIASKITVEDLASGNIDTRQIHIISSDDGSGITIADQTMQFKDTDGSVRIQIGEDSNGNFSFILTGPNGTQLLTETGLQPGAVADKFIKNEMVDDKAISKRNIDWVTAGATVDEDGNPVWDTSHLTMNGEKFEVGFNRLQNNVDTMSSTVENNYNELVNMIGTFDGTYEIRLFSSDGTVFEMASTVTTSVTCKVYKYGVDITNEIPEENFYWAKYLDTGNIDLEWTNTHEGTRTVYFADEIINNRIYLTCTVDIPDVNNNDDANVQ